MQRQLVAVEGICEAIAAVRQHQPKVLTPRYFDTIRNEAVFFVRATSGWRFDSSI